MAAAAGGGASAGGSAGGASGGGGWQSLAGSSGGGASSGYQAALSIAGKAEQDIASFLTPFFTSRELRKGNTAAKEAVTSGYDTGAENLRTGYETGRGDIQTGTGQSIGALERGYAGAEAAQEPYYQQGTQGLSNLAQMAGTGFQFNEGDITMDPSYQFRLQEGQRAIQSGAAANGGLLSGAAQKALAKYGQTMASQEYANAYNRAYNKALDTYQSKVGLNQALAGYGQNAANNISGYRSNLGTQSANVYGAQGQNLANMANQYGVNASNMAIDRGNSLANIAMQRALINAGEWQGYGNAAIGQGQHFQEIGANLAGPQQNNINNQGKTVTGVDYNYNPSSSSSYNTNASQYEVAQNNRWS